MRTVRIYDCSNSPERPEPRGYGGSIENACVTMLKKYAQIIIVNL